MLLISMVNFPQQYQLPIQWLIWPKLSGFFTSPQPTSFQALLLTTGAGTDNFFGTLFNFCTKTSFPSFHPSKTQFELVYNVNQTYIYNQQKQIKDSAEVQLQIHL